MVEYDKFCFKSKEKLKYIKKKKKTLLSLWKEKR